MNLLLCAITFNILERVAIKHEGKDSVIGKALENSTKEMLSIVLYVLSTFFAFFTPIFSLIGYTLVAIIWLIPDQRIEKQLK